MNKTKNVFFIQILDALIGGILSIVIPLLMIERNIDVVTIGLIFAALPLVFQSVRLACAAVSDIIGRKLFFVLNGILNVLMLIIYYFSFTPLEFLFGKVTQGVKSASLWSVNRPSLLDHGKEKRKKLATMMGISNIARAIGSIMAGFLIVWIFYMHTLFFCMIIGLLIIPIALFMKGKKDKLDIKKVFSILDFRKRHKIFKKFFIIFFITGLSSGFISGYIFPLFLKSNGFSTEIIGFVLGIYTLLIGILSIYTRKINIKKLVLMAGILYPLLLILLGFSSYILAILFLLFIGIASGIDHGVMEGILSKITKVNSYGSDIGILMVGLHTGKTVSLAVSGILITISGFLGLFSISALIYVVYFVLIYYNLKKIK